MRARAQAELDAQRDWETGRGHFKDRAIHWWAASSKSYQQAYDAWWRDAQDQERKAQAEETEDGS